MSCSTSINRFGKRKLFYYFNNFHFLIAVSIHILTLSVTFVVLCALLFCFFTVAGEQRDFARFLCKVRWHYIGVDGLMLLHLPSRESVLWKTKYTKRAHNNNIISSKSSSSCYHFPIRKYFYENEWLIGAGIHLICL